MASNGPAHLKPESKPRQVVTVREGALFLCPGGLAHSPRRGEGIWGLVVERKRKPDENEELAWFCASIATRRFWREP
jgi:hypothetical protein